MIKGIKKMLYVATAGLMMAAPLNAAGNNNELICIDPGHQVWKKLRQAHPQESQKFHREQEEWLQKNMNISLRWKLG